MRATTPAQFGGLGCYDGAIASSLLILGHSLHLLPAAFAVARAPDGDDAPPTDAAARGLGAYAHGCGCDASRLKDRSDARNAHQQM